MRKPSEHQSPTGAIVATRLGRDFGGVPAVRSLDLHVQRGEIYGFLGPNGAGKSTTVRMLCTLLAPTSGQATVAGYDVDTDPGQVRLRIGVALQGSSLDESQTGRELLRLQGRLYGLDRVTIDRRVAEVVDLVGIGESIDDLIKTYSGGMKRRLDLASSLVHQPEVLFLDEPTTGLDPASRARMWAEVRRLNDAGTTIFLTTQYLEEADALADRIGIIIDGSLVVEGTPADLKRQIGRDIVIATVSGPQVAVAVEALTSVPAVEDVTAHGDTVTMSVADGEATLLTIATTLDRAGVSVRSLATRTPTLDDVFLHHTGERFEADAPTDATPEQGVLA
ncbi:MAG: ATP-binding cassette domain-containing protein [Ornithinimicrobium sp.]